MIKIYIIDYLFDDEVDTHHRSGKVVCYEAGDAMDMALEHNSQTGDLSLIDKELAPYDLTDEDIVFYWEGEFDKYDLEENFNIEVFDYKEEA